MKLNVTHYLARIKLALERDNIDLAHRVIDDYARTSITEGKPVTLDTWLAAIEEIPTRSANDLQRNGITTIRDLIAKTPEELLSIKYLGEQSVRDVVRVVGRLKIDMGIRK